MRKNIKTCIYVVTAILPVILSACSNKADDIPKSTKKSTTTSTTFAEDTSSDITNTTVETTTEEDTTELISETEQEVINSTENITEQQQTQAYIQQTTIITSVNPTPAPITTTPRPTETEQTTTPVTPEYEYPEYPEYPNPILTVKGIGEKYSYNGIEFTIDSIEYVYPSVDDDGYCEIHLDNINISLTEPISPYFTYNIYSSDGVFIETGTIHLYYSDEISPTDPLDSTKLLTVSGSVYTKRMPIDDYTIEFVNYQ